MKISLILFAALVIGAGPATATEYTAQFKGDGFAACYKGEEKISSAKFCGICRKNGGDNIVWKYQTFCQNKDETVPSPTKKEVWASLSCEPVLDEEEQETALKKVAAQFIDNNLPPLYSFRKCNLEDWPKEWWQKKDNWKKIAVGAGIATAAAVAFIVKPENDPWGCYDIKRKEGKKGKCVNKAGNFMSRAEFCHNCGSKQFVQWDFQILRNNEPTNKFVKGTLACKQSIPDENKKQRKLIEQSAREAMEKLKNDGQLAICDGN